MSEPKKTTSVLPRGNSKGRPGVPPSTAGRVRELIEELLEREPYRGRGGITRLAESLQIKQPALTQIRQGGGVSIETTLAVARIAGVDERELLEGAYMGTAIKGRFPFLEVVVAYQAGSSNPLRWSAATIAAARAGAWPNDTTTDEWTARLDSLEKQMRSLAEGGPANP